MSSATGGVGLGESVLMAFAAIRAHKLRSLLTLLGVIIGVTAVIGMMSIIRGVQLQMEQQMTVLQSSVFQVQKWPMVADFGGRRERDNRPNLEPEYGEAIRERCPDVTLVGVEAWQFGVAVRYGDKTSTPTFVLAGGTPEFFPNNGYYIEEGRGFMPDDVDHGRMVTVVGASVVEEVFPFEDPIGKEIKVVWTPQADWGEDTPVDAVTIVHRFTIVGVIEKKGGMFGNSEDNRVVIPFSTFEDLYGAHRSVNITVQARTPELFQEAQDQVTGVVRELRGLKPGDKDNFALFSSQMAIEQFNNMTRVIKIAAVGVCGMSLLVAGIGIMNIMLVSVSERTREIGVRKAMGARRFDIMRQFVVEAIVLSEIGGILGVLGGIGLATGVSAAVPALKSAVPVWAVVLGLGFCSLVGLFFGIYPATRASRLDPIEALRYE